MTRMLTGEQIARAALLAARLSDTAQMRSQHPSWLLAELEDAAETITALLQLARAVQVSPRLELPTRRGPALAGPTLHITANAAEKWGMDGQTVALVPVPVKEG